MFNLIVLFHLPWIEIRINPDPPTGGLITGTKNMNEKTVLELLINKP